jgi:hypothetical protein
MKDLFLEYSLWIYGLFAAMLGGGFMLLNNGKQSKETCQAVHKAVDERLQSMDSKLDKLLDIHLNGKK